MDIVKDKFGAVRILTRFWLLQEPAEDNVFNIKYFCNNTYDPIEQVWRRLKPLIHAAETIDGGNSELLSRVRKVMSAKINGILATALNVGLGIWKSLI